MAGLQRYRLRAPASGREVVLALDSTDLATEDNERAYYDRVTGERLEVVSKLVPLSSSPSNLPRSPETVRICPHCDELVELDLSDCPYCHRRLPALGDGGH
jgi:RecB family exonuclease